MEYSDDGIQVTLPWTWIESFLGTDENENQQFISDTEKQLLKANPEFSRLFFEEVLQSTSTISAPMWFMLEKIGLAQ